MLFQFFPLQHGAVAAGRVGTGEVHGVGAARGGALADVAVTLQREEHEVVVEVVLPEELLGFLKVGGEAHVAGQTVAVDLDVAAVGALQGNTALAAVDDLELRQLALVAGVGVVEQAVLQGDGRAARGLVDAADGLAVGDVRAAVGARLVDGEVVELGIAALLTFYINPTFTF